MFFTKFNPLTDEEVLQKVNAQRRPAGGGKGYLAGKSFKARLDGEFAPKQLDYVFKDEERPMVKQSLDAKCSDCWSKYFQNNIQNLKPQGQQNSIYSETLLSRSVFWELRISTSSWM